MWQHPPLRAQILFNRDIWPKSCVFFTTHKSNWFANPDLSSYTHILLDRLVFVRIISVVQVPLWQLISLLRECWQVPSTGHGLSRGRCGLCAGLQGLFELGCQCIYIGIKDLSIHALVLFLVKLKQNSTTTSRTKLWWRINYCIKIKYLKLFNVLNSENM